MRDLGGLIWSGRNGPGLSRGEYCLQWHVLKHISNRSGDDPVVVTPWPTNHDRDRETSLGLVNPETGPQLRASFCVNPTWTNDQHYAMRLTPGRREGVMYHPSSTSIQGGVRSFDRPPLRLAPWSLTGGFLRAL